MDAGFEETRNVGERKIIMAVLAGHPFDLIYSNDFKQRNHRHSCDLICALLVD